MRIADRVEILSITQDGSMNPVVIWDDSDVVLIDTGTPGQAPLFGKALEKIGLSVRGLTRILLTHQDMDHIGSARELAALSGAKVYAHALEAPYIQNDVTPLRAAVMEARDAERTPERQKAIDDIKARGELLKVRIDHALQDGEVLPFCGGLRILHTPGHMPGHICVYLERARVLVTGDALNGAQGKLMGPNPHFTVDMPQALESLRKLQGLAPDAVLCYHGGLVRGDIDERLEEIIHSR